MVSVVEESLASPFEPTLPARVTDTGGDAYWLEILRHPNSGEPIFLLHELDTPTRIEQAFETFLRLWDDLILGADPQGVYPQLQRLVETWEWCPFESEEAKVWAEPLYNCASCWYTLGLAAETAGEEAAAVRHYQRILKFYPDRMLAQLTLTRLGP